MVCSACPTPLSHLQKELAWVWYDKPVSLWYLFERCNDSVSTGWPPEGAGGPLKDALPHTHCWWSWLGLKPAHLPSHHLLRWWLGASPGLLAESFQVLLCQSFWGLKCRAVSLAEVPVGKCEQMSWTHPML